MKAGTRLIKDRVIEYLQGGPRGFDELLHYVNINTRRGTFSNELCGVLRHKEFEKIGERSLRRDLMPAKRTRKVSVWSLVSSSNDAGGAVSSQPRPSAEESPYTPCSLCGTRRDHFNTSSNALRDNHSKVVPSISLLCGRCYLVWSQSQRSGSNACPHSSCGGVLTSNLCSCGTRSYVCSVCSPPTCCKCSKHQGGE